jgi:UDP-N-acetylmuramoylalanine--D-glutamate ligase
MGVAHRLQMVREVNGVRYYNDSIATAPERLMAGIRAFEPKQRIILLCGGKDKYLPWGDAITLINERCAHVVFFGELGPMVANKFSDLTHQTAIVVKTLREAVECAAEIAKKGDVVLLSPGGTSFDEFKDFAERGEKFTQWIQQL